MSDISQQLQEAVSSARKESKKLQIVGGNSKAFYGRTPSGETLDVSKHSGIISYEPTELFITARGGTPLKDIEAALNENNQMLPFEPPHFGEHATLGGTIACNLSGPRRPYAGAARDHILGIKLLNGKGEILSFGGEVMKNVAGYDVSRLMSGALGTLGILLEISLKVLPRPEQEYTLAKEVDEKMALDAMTRWSRKPIPMSAALYDGNRLYLRLCGTPRSVEAAIKKIGGEEISSGADFWQRVNEHQHAFFDSTYPLWRLSLAPYTPLIDIDGKWILDWGGAQRWLLSDAPASAIRAAAEHAGGHATLFRGGDHDGNVFQPLAPKLMQLHHNLKQAFDPHGIFNPGRMYTEI